MAEILVRDLDDDLAARLRRRALAHGRTPEEEARAILHEAIGTEATPTTPLGSRLRARFADIGLEQEITEFRAKPAHAAHVGKYD